MKVFKRLRAFLNGVREFRLSCTTEYPNCTLQEAYERGRELAHRLTMRRYDY